MPVTAFKEFCDRQQSKKPYYYYHRTFRRVPDLTECHINDYVCIYEQRCSGRETIRWTRR